MSSNKVGVLDEPLLNVILGDREQHHIEIEVNREELEKLISDVRQIVMEMDK